MSWTTSKSVSVAVASAAAVIPFTAAPASSSTSTTSTPAVTSATGAAGATLRAVNAQRARHGLRRLRVSRKLTRSANGHTRAMIATRTFAHDTAGEPTLKQRVRRVGYTRDVGEVLAWGSGSRSTPRAAVQSWMLSPPHRRILLTRRYRVGGVGVVASSPTGGGGRTYTMHVGG